VDWPQLAEALLLVIGGLALAGVWAGARRRDRRAARALRLSEQRFRDLTLLSADWFWETDAEHRIIWLSGGSAVAELFGGELAHGKRLWELPGVEVEPRALVEHFERLQREDAQLPFFDFVISRDAGGQRRTHAVRGKPYYDAAGRFLGYRGVGQDITEKRSAERALAEREQRFRDVLDASGEYVWETGADWRYTFLSPRVETVLGYLRHEMIGRTPREFMPLGEAQPMDEWFAKHDPRAGFRDLVHRSLTKSGRIVWQSVNCVPVFDAAGKLSGYRGTGADITARTQAEDRIRFLATRDTLTGLPNRVLLSDRASQAILAAARARGSVAILYLDLDRFKLVNDSMGHAAGDALLRAVAERLGASLLPDDTLARIGGDEFVLLANGLKNSQDAATLAQRALADLARPFTVEGRTLSVTASIGISVYPVDGRDFGELLKNAGTAANHAKEKGGERFLFFSPELNARAVARLGMENDLRRALARGELLLHWQPVMSGKPVRAGARMVGAEVLVRWQHPQEGMLMPDRFISVAEDCGLIRPLGQWTLERALSQVGAWRRGSIGAAARDIWFALNVSANELAEGDAYVAQVAAALAANDVPGACIELEITERVLMSHLPQNVETLRKLGALGLRVAIDDFGTGYSSLAYLRQLPIDKLKIDRSFLRELDAHPADATIVQTIAAMAKALGLRVAAEGVESAAQVARLQALGCEEWQGHHFSASLDAAGFERLLTQKFALTG
jgi:diguanylate cyclase (GGDEF)-like protein/PAS domain S-box-containing protein